MTRPVDVKGLPHRVHVHAEDVADIDERERPIGSFGCNPLDRLRGLLMGHTAALSLSAPHGVFEYRRDERELRKPHRCAAR